MTYYSQSACRAIAAASIGTAVIVSAMAGRGTGLSASTASARQPASTNFELRPVLVFSSTRDNPAGVGSGTAQEKIFNAAEIYLMLMNDAGDRASEPRRLTNDRAGDGFATISPSGKQLVFDSNRYRDGGEPYQVSDLFFADLGLYNQAVSPISPAELLHLTRGSSATWSPDGKRIAFHASDSGIYTTGTLARPDPGTPALDSDIFVLNVDDCLAHQDQCAAKADASGSLPEFLVNVTKDHGAPSIIDEDPDWSPDGLLLAFTRHDGEAGTFFTQNHNNANAEVYLLGANGRGDPQQVTNNVEEERSPSWSPDGSRILYSCRRSDPPGQLVPFQLCVAERDGQGGWTETLLTDDGRQHLTPQWSTDGHFIVFHQSVAGLSELFRLSFVVTDAGTASVANQTQLTAPPVDVGVNLFASWDVIRARTK